jgi:hypothetical protein
MPRAGVVLGVLVALFAVTQPASVAAATQKPPPVFDTWRPHVQDAAAWAARRRGEVAFAVRAGTHAGGRRESRRFQSASLLKPMLMVARLRSLRVRDRPLRRDERLLLTRMITRSDDPAANRLIGVVGARGLRRLAARAGMRSFVPVTGIWGRSTITAADQVRFFLRLRELLPARHRAFALSLLAAIVPSQRWGIGRVALPAGWQLRFKGGWGSGSGALDHQVALLERGQDQIALAILTHGSPSHEYGKRTLEGIARRLLRGLP